MRFAGLDENGMHRIRLTHRSLGPDRSRRMVRHHPGRRTVQRQRSGGIEDVRRSNGSSPRCCLSSTNRRPRLPVSRMLLRRWHARYGRRCHRRPQLPRTGRRRHGHADRRRAATSRCSPIYPTCSTRSAATRKRPVRFPPMWFASHHRPTAPCRPSGSVPTRTRPSSIPNSTSRASSPGSTSTRTTATSHPNRLSH